MVSQTNTYLGTEELLRVEPEEGLDKVEEGIDVCQSFMKSYHNKKSDVAQHFKAEVPVVEWSFNDELIFSRLKTYLERLATVQVSYIYARNFEFTWKSIIE